MRGQKDLRTMTKTENQGKLVQNVSKCSNDRQVSFGTDVLFIFIVSKHLVIY